MCRCQVWVDHEEPLQALRIVNERGVIWTFGDLSDGYEFVVWVDAKVW